MSDVGFTHVALLAKRIEESIDFYGRFADMEVVHRRADPDTGHAVIWLSDRTRPFVLVLLETARVDHRLSGFAHLGVGCASSEEVDRRCALARAENRNCIGPIDGGKPVGYFALISDPDGHNLELSYGQEVGLTVKGSAHT
jgi:catechol 2,3-dioxygenase-like lactoylglutathione lyase family enzyme